MRKVMTALLAFLLIFSFASCEKDKSEDTIATYEKFITSKKTLSKLNGLFVAQSSGATVSDFSAEIGQDDVVTEGLSALLKALDAKYAKISSITAENATTGNLALSFNGTKETLTFGNISIAFKYTVEGATEEITDKLTLNGTMVLEIVSSRGDGGMKYTYDLTINGKAYRLSYEYDGGKYKSAAVDGKDIDLTLLNIRSKYL